MKDNDTIESHIAKFRMLRTQLITAGQNVDELQSAVALLMSLPEKYRAFVSTQNQSISTAAATAAAGAAPAITLLDVIGALLNEEATHKSSRIPPASSARALYATRGRGRGRFQPSRASSSSSWGNKIPGRNPGQPLNSWSSNTKPKGPCT